MTQEPPASRKRGIFSLKSDAAVERPRGQRSRSSNSKGRDTKTGLLIRASMKHAVSAVTVPNRGRRACAAYTRSVANPKNRLSRSLRSEIQATDSTRRGWSAKMAATAALFTGAPVIARSAEKSIPVAPRCSSRFTRCGPRGLIAEEVGVQQVRDPGHRLPVGRGEGRHRPGETRARQSALQPGIPADVRFVVENEARLDDLPVRRDDRGRQQERDNHDRRGRSRFPAPGPSGQGRFPMRPYDLLSSGGDCSRDQLHQPFAFKTTKMVQATTVARL